MQPEPSFLCSQCRHMMVSCLLCDWASYSYIPITTVFCLQRRFSTWNYAHLGAWDTPLGFERLSLVTLQLNNAEIHVTSGWKAGWPPFKLPVPVSSCYLSVLLVEGRGALQASCWRQPFTVGRAGTQVREDASYFRGVPKLSKLKSISFLRAIPWIGKWDIFPQLLYVVTDFISVKRDIFKGMKLEPFAVPQKYTGLFVLGCC